MDKPFVLITDNELIMKDSGFPGLLEDLAEVRFAPEEAWSDDEELSKYMKDVAVLLVGGAPITLKVMEGSNKLRAVARMGAGYDSVDVKTATEKAVMVINTPRTSVEGMVEHVLGTMIYLSRAFFWADKMVRAGKFREAQNALHGSHSRIQGKTLGIVGLGAVGSKLAERAHGFLMKILGYDPYVTRESAQEIGVQPVELETLIRESDFISLHTALTEETRYLIGEAELKLMKKTAYLINNSRGGIIEEKALYKALSEGWIAGASLDVFDREPPAPDNPLLHLDNVIVTPHIAGADRERAEGIAKLTAANIRRILKGELPLIDCLVNVAVLGALGRKNS